MPPLLNSIPPPLLEDLLRGRWLPVIGAGFSKNAVVPPGTAMPNWRELGDQLSRDNPSYAANGPIDAVSGFEAAFDRPRLVQRLAAAVLAGRATPGPAHTAFCRIPFEIVVTTNIDTLLEQEYLTLGKQCHPVLDEAQLAISNPYDGPLLLKLHGDIHHPARLIVTEEDYDAFLIRHPMMATYVTSLLLTKVAVLIGYSLEDPDFRHLLTVVGERLGPHRPRPWAVTVDEDPSSVTRFERRNVRVVNLSSGRRSKAETLAQFFSEIAGYWIENVPRFTRHADPRMVELQFSEATALCVVDAPVRLHTFYVDQVFPALESVGLTPISPHVVAAPEGSGRAATEALFSRAAAIVIDVGDGTGWFDLRLARALNPDARLVVVATSPLPEVEYPVLLRSENPIEDEDLAQGLAGAMAEVAQHVEVLLRDEPERLLAIKAYGAAVVSAFSAFEAQLRRRFGFDPKGRERRTMSTVPEMIRFLVTEQVLTVAAMEPLLTAWRVRNEVVHEGQQPRGQDAHRIVRLVGEAQRRLTEDGF